MSETRTIRTRRALRTTGVRSAVSIVALAFTVAAVAKSNDPLTPKPSAVVRMRQWFETGKASLYALRLQGHRTATGEKYDMRSLTCAHRTLPLGSWIRVTNLTNRKSVFVRVNDRGPFGSDRIVDLSSAAARILGLDGVSNVKLEALNPANAEMARALVAQLAEPQFPTTVQ